MLRLMMISSILAGANEVEEESLVNLHTKQSVPHHFVNLDAERTSQSPS